MQGTNGTPRRGFTLIELLVVIIIIGILSSMLLVAVSKIRGSGPPMQVRSEFTSFSGAMSEFRQDFNVEYFPSSVVLAETQYNMANAADIRSVAFLRTIFGNSAIDANGLVGPNNKRPNGTVWPGIDWNGNGTKAGKFTLTGEQCLVHFLGGIPSTASGSNQVLGFARTAGDPAAAGGKRYGPYFHFKPTRLLAGSNGFFTYRDPFERANGVATSYAYFVGGKGGWVANANSTGAYFYADSVGGSNPVNASGYQIICAGQDGIFGSTPSARGSWTGAGTSSSNGTDDLANFSRAQLLGAGN